MEPAAQERAHAIFDPIVDSLLERDGVDLGPMFGVTGVRVRGKVFACIGYDADLMLKLPRDRVDELESEAVATRIVMRGRPLKEWAFVDAAHAALWEQLAVEAHAVVDEITPRDAAPA